MGACDFPAPGMNRLQLSSLEVPLPVVRWVPACASSPSLTLVHQSLGRQVRKAVEVLFFGNF